MKLGMILLLTATALVASTACKGVRTPAPERLPFPNLYLPRNFNNADPSPKLDESVPVLSILDETHIWVGPNEYSDTQGFEEIENAVRQAPQKVVYVRAGGTLDYVAVVKAIQSARKAGALEFALRVQMPGTERQFTIKVLPEPADTDTFSEKKDPARVGVTLSADLKITLVKGGLEGGPAGFGGTKEEMGTLSDTSRLVQALTQTLGDRTDRKVTIKAFRATRYDNVVTIIDAVKGARANPIVLQIDDLP